MYAVISIITGIITGIITSIVISIQSLNQYFFEK